MFNLTHDMFVGTCFHDHFVTLKRVFHSYDTIQALVCGPHDNHHDG